MCCGNARRCLAITPLIGEPVHAVPTGLPGPDGQPRLQRLAGRQVQAIAGRCNQRRRFRRPRRDAAGGAEWQLRRSRDRGFQRYERCACSAVGAVRCSQCRGGLACRLWPVGQGHALAAPWKRLREVRESRTGYHRAHGQRAVGSRGVSDQRRGERRSSPDRTQLGGFVTRPPPDRARHDGPGRGHFSAGDAAGSDLDPREALQASDPNPLSITR